jgi:urease accessory protein
MLHGENCSEEFVASRETAELRAETLQMGHSLARLLASLGVHVPEGEMAFPAVYAVAARAWSIEPRAALVGYLWGWLENQVMAAVKAVPLGQTAGQGILVRMGEAIERIAAFPESEFANFAPGLAVLSARHETQYSRLFRS